MRILLVTKKSPFPSRDGEAIALRNMMDQYLALGWQVDMLSMITPKHPYSSLDHPEAKAYGSVGFYEAEADTTPSKLGGLRNLIGNRPYHMERFDHRGFRTALNDLMQKEQYDVVQLEGLYMLNYLEQVRNNCPAKVIYRSHNIEGNIWKRLAMQEQNRWRRWYLDVQAERLLEAERQLQDQADFILSISISDASAYRQYSAKEKVAYLPTGYDFPDTAPASTQPTLYYIGALDWLPNLTGLQKFLEESWPLIRQEVPGASMYVAGRHAPEGFAEHLPAGIHYVGEVADAERFVREHGICVVPLWAGSGLKIKIVEAMALAKPLVSTPVGMEGLPSGLEEYYIIEQDPARLASRVATWIKEWPAPVSAASKAAELVRHTLSNESVSEQLKSIIQQWNL